MNEEVLTTQGRLADAYLPAVYFDSSVLIEYWETESAIGAPAREFPSSHEDDRDYVRGLLRTDRRFGPMVKVREALLFEETKATAVVCPLSVLELVEWYAEASFKNLAADAAGTNAIQRKSKKEIGRLLVQVLEAVLELNRSGDNSSYSPVAHVFGETFVNPGFAHLHGLKGVVVADIVGLFFSERDTWEVAQFLAYLQMGMADIVQLLVARHLGCSWFASFDSDFDRCREHVKDGLGMSLLSTPEQILGILV